MIITKFFPLKYLTSPEAGYTIREVPPIIKVSTWEIAFIAPSIVSLSKGSSYKTKELTNNCYGNLGATEDVRKGSTEKYPKSIITFQKTKFNKKA